MVKLSLILLLVGAVVAIEAYSTTTTRYPTRTTTPTRRTTTPTRRTTTRRYRFKREDEDADAEEAGYYPTAQSGWTTTTRRQTTTPRRQTTTPRRKTTTRRAYYQDVDAEEAGYYPTAQRGWTTTTRRQTTTPRRHTTTPRRQTTTPKRKTTTRRAYYFNGYQGEEAGYYPTAQTGRVTGSTRRYYKRNDEESGYYPTAQTGRVTGSTRRYYKRDAYTTSQRPRTTRIYYADDPVATAEPATDAPGSPQASVTPTPSRPTTDYKRTLILIEAVTYSGQSVFIRGGIDYKHKTGCAEANKDLDNNPCAIPIRHRDLEVTSDNGLPERDDWAVGDNFLDWEGAEPQQGAHNGANAQGTPGQWTTNQPGNQFYSDLNKYGEHYWVVDVDMDCSKTENSFFEIKALINGAWEGSQNLEDTCSGSEGTKPPYDSPNHFARCGYVNVFHFNQKRCEILRFDDFLTPPLD